MSERLYFDIESDNLLDLITKVHCIAITNMDTGEESYYGPAVPKTHPKWDPLVGNPVGTVEDGLRRLMGASLTVAHNGVDFDYVACEMVYPWFRRPAKAWDSLVAAKIVWPYDVLFGPDLKRFKAGLMPMSMVKRHSLEAWGYRLGEFKDGYDGDHDKFPEPRDRPAKKGDERYDRRWEEWNPFMASYMMQDNRPGVKLWRMIEERVGWKPSDKPVSVVWPEAVFEVEHEVARIIKQQELDGVRFDLDRAHALAAELTNEEARIADALVETFGSWWHPGPVTTPARAMSRKREDLPYITRKRISAKTGKELAPYVGPPLEHYAPDAPYTPIERVTFSPSSRDHLGQRLQAVFGWKPKKFGKNGKPTVDETVLEEIPEAVIPQETRRLILDYFVVAKTLGTLARGKKSWLKLGETGRIHGRMDTAGAITGRGTHKDPNLSGVPSVKKEKVVLEDGSKVERVVKGLAGRYGYECKELFVADDGWEFTDVDASSLELIDLGHYLFPLDGGAFSARVCDPDRDPHQEHADLADMLRADAKTAIYLFVYGGGAYKLSLSLTVEQDEVVSYLGYKGLPMLLRNLEKRFDADFVAKLDDTQKARIAKARIIITKFEANIAGLKDLIADVSAVAQKRGWLRALDGRRLVIRKAYSALNSLLQSAGAQTCKLWMVLLHRRLVELGLKPGVDFKQVLWVHDALSFTHRPGLGPIILQAAKETIIEAGKLLGLRGEYRAAGATGVNWAQVH